MPTRMIASLLNLQHAQFTLFMCAESNNRTEFLCHVNFWHKAIGSERLAGLLRCRP